MVDITCPWCDENGLQPLLEFDEPQADFTCAECGTTVQLSEEPVVLDLAA